MPYSQEHKQRSREKILDSANKLFMSKGYDNVTINELMTDAGLTRGAFYAHFKSKSELYAEAILSAASKSPVRQHAPHSANAMSEIERLNRVIDLYLSSEHIQDDGYCCPLAFLVTDISNRDPEVRNTYTQIYKRLAQLMAHQTNGKPTDDINTTWAVTALMIGGVAVCRALNDEKMIQQVLHASRETAKQLIQGRK